MTERDGWTPGTFQIAMGTPGDHGIARCESGRETVSGETWGAFGLNRDGRRWLWIVTHLPTGSLIASFERKVEAKRFCRWIAPLTDWDALDGTRRLPDDLRRVVRDAMAECNAVFLVKVL